MISSRGTRTVRLQRRKSGLDFSIRGGKEHGIGVVISWIKEGGAAKSLSLGDEILAVNGKSLHGLSHTQVVNTLNTAGASVVLLIRPNTQLQDIFSNSTSVPPGPQRGLSPVSPLSPETPAPAISKSSPLPSSPLPNGWSQKLDQKTGRVYFENHHTWTSTWTDPRSRQPVSIERFHWDALPPGWERFVDTQGDTYYVNHHTQTTHWDSPNGTRQLQLLQQLREFLTIEKEKAKVAEEELASKRKLLLSKNNELDNQLASGSHDLEGVGHEESHDLDVEEGHGDSKTNLIDDIMFLNEEVDAQDEHVSGVRRHLQSLMAVLQSAKVEDLAGGEGLSQRGAGLALSLSKELGNLHMLMKALVEMVDSISQLQRNKQPSATQLHYMLQLPTLVEKKTLLERQCWVHTLPDKLTAKTNCELEVELLLIREGVAYAQSLQHKLGVLHKHARSHQGWEELVQQLTSLDFQLLQTLYTAKYDFREKLEKLMMF